MAGTDLNIVARLARAKYCLQGSIVEDALAKLARAAKANFDPNQPHVPRGNPDGGRWTRVGGESSADSRSGAGSAGGDAARLTGGFTEDQLGLTVESFVSAYCQGIVRRILPSQFLGVTIAEVMGAAKSGDPAARRCLKLLGREKYRK